MNSASLSWGISGALESALLLVLLPSTERAGFFLFFLSEIQKRSESLFTLGGIGVVPKAWGPLTAAHGENSAPRPEHLPHTAINRVVA